MSLCSESLEHGRIGEQGKERIIIPWFTHILITKIIGHYGVTGKSTPNTEARASLGKSSECVGAVAGERMAHAKAQWHHYITGHA